MTRDRHSTHLVTYSDQNVQYRIGTASHHRSKSLKLAETTAIDKDYKRKCQYQLVPHCSLLNVTVLCHMRMQTTPRFTDNVSRLTLVVLRRGCLSALTTFRKPAAAESRQDRSPLVCVITTSTPDPDWACSCR